MYPGYFGRQDLNDENIRYQIITFLIAGHETTAGLLAFTLHQLARSPALFARIRAEVDAVSPAGMPTMKQVLELDLVRRTLSESLRLWPTVPAVTRAAREDTILGGRTLNLQRIVALVGGIAQVLSTKIAKSVKAGSASPQPVSFAGSSDEPWLIWTNFALGVALALLQIRPRRSSISLLPTKGSPTGLIAVSNHQSQTGTAARPSISRIDSQLVPLRRRIRPFITIERWSSRVKGQGCNPTSPAPLDG